MRDLFANEEFVIGDLVRSRAQENNSVMIDSR